MLEFIIAAVLGGTVGGMAIALFSGQKVAKMGAENEILKTKIADLQTHQDYIANSKANVQKQYRT